jgi:hypothetical protein
MKIQQVLCRIALCFCIFAGSGYAFGQKLYPVQGPLAAQTPQPVFTGQIRHPMFSAGPVFLLLKILDRCQWRGASGEAQDGEGLFSERSA